MNIAPEEKRKMGDAAIQGREDPEDRNRRIMGDGENFGNLLEGYRLLRV